MAVGHWSGPLLLVSVLVAVLVFAVLVRDDYR
jgi:hypothetical protein